MKGYHNYQNENAYSSCGLSAPGLLLDDLHVPDGDNSPLPEEDQEAEDGHCPGHRLGGRGGEGSDPAAPGVCCHTVSVQEQE